MASAVGRLAVTRSAARRVTRTLGLLSDAAVANLRVSVPSGDAGDLVNTVVSTRLLIGRVGRVTVETTTRASTGGAGALEPVTEPASATTSDCAATGSGWATDGAGDSDAGGAGPGAAGLGAGCSAAGGVAGAAGAGAGTGAGGVAGTGGGWGALRDGSKPSGST